MKKSTSRIQYSCEEFKYQMHVRLQQMETHRDAHPYASVLAVLRQNVDALQMKRVA